MAPAWTPRPLIVNVLKEFQRNYDEHNNSVAFLQLPTGYGKSTITLALASHVICKGHLGRGVIHVLPLRSIITDLNKRLRKWFPRVGLSTRDLAAQHMGSAGSPFFAKHAVVTTLDTFSLNFFKLPAVEVSKALRTGNAHFEFPRGQIYSSIVIFDESHLFALDNSGTYKQMFTILLCTLTQLSCAGVPIFVITATLPTKIRDYIQKQLFDSRIITSVYRQGDDPLFENKEGRRKISTSILSTDEEAIKIIKTARSQKPRILVIVNEVSRAIHFYKKLKDYDPVLLHGRITESERKVNVDRLDATNPWLVIGTQVIEAGIDVDANVLVTDLAPMDRLVQRIGRVARTGNGSEGEVYVIPNYSTVYPASDLKKTLHMLDRSGKDIDWVFGAQQLVDDAYSTLSVPDMIDRNLLGFLERIDENLLYGSGDMRDLLTALGSFPREAVLIKAYADAFFYNKTLTDPDGYIGLESWKAYQALCNSKRVVENNRIVELEPEMLRDIGPHNLQRTLEQHGYNGILLDHYERGVGYL